ncbi:hypothetical protein [Flagellimonas pelagia]|uniref:Lipoprotein n=1 Tax=Flagellimonas pelagia TaxID=2306998 RepID=A0A3A1NEB2_9FLAO|nr:hypothetical protein [Allomuricauda maritima]RIV43027.1 hypothetical protein D2V05_15590 [Allomuricauda maritima]TXJ92226.1 hypothetical protein FQ017_15455 [Allomuricauda maritima]
MSKVPVFLFSILLMVSCGKPVKKYEDYDEDDFTEVQGIVIKVDRNYSYLKEDIRNVYYIYNLGKERPDIGYELNCPFLPMEGEPAIILVNRNEKDVTFMARSGIIDEEEEVLLQYLEKCDQMGGGYYGLDEQKLNK